MKQFLLLAFFSVFTLGLNAQVVYVDDDVAANGDGTTWATAYKSLNDALLAAPSGSSVWIADGTYITPDSVSFFIDKELTVLGGFNGTETDASAADPDVNVTILSGDVMGNDGATYDSLTFADNNRVLFITDTNDVSAYTVTLDGLTIANGGLAQDQPAGTSLVLFSGGGIRTFARTSASRLKFTGNRANYGSAIAAVFRTSSGSVFDDITLEGNFSSFAHQFYTNGPDEIMVKNSNFIAADDEEQESGFMSINFARGAIIDNCNFSNLTTMSMPTTLGGRASGLRATACDRFLVKNSTFNNLRADLGGAVLIAQFGDSEPAEGETMGLDDFVFDNCTFTGNTAARGAAIGSFNTNINVTNSTFTDNRSSDIGGALYMQPDDSRSYLHNYSKSVIRDNQSAVGGGAIFMLSNGVADITGTIDGCTIEGNKTNSDDGQGAFALLSGKSNFTVSNSVFSNNVAGFGTLLSRGAIGLNVKNVKFEDNGNLTDAFQGAGIVAYFFSGSTGMLVDSSEFISNIVTQNGNNIRSGGAAIFGVGFTLDETPIVIINSNFSGNTASATASGGAVLVSGGSNLIIDNCNFDNNSAGGEGGAIDVVIGEFSRDTMNSVVTVIKDPFSGSITNSRFFTNNSASQGGAIATQGSLLDLANNVFVGNSAFGASGGAIIFNGNGPFADGEDNIREVGSFVLDGNLVNNTFALNSRDEDAYGDDIALFQPGDINDTDSNSMRVVLLNNAFLNATGRPSIEIEPGTSNPGLGFISVGDLFVESLGGNLYNAEISPEFVLDAADIENDTLVATDVFIDAADNDGNGNNTDLIITSPLTSNPLINNGVANALVPETDVRGNPRGDAPDIGAHEAEQGAVSTGEPIENSGLDITFFPNPTQDILNVRNDETTIEQFTLIVADQTGRILKANRMNGTNNRIDFTNVPAGVYNLQVVVNGKIYSKQIVKQ